MEIDNVINEIVDGYQKYDVQKQALADMTTYMLIVRRLVLTDSGTYTCQINVKAATDHPSKDGVIVVLSEFCTACICMPSDTVIPSISVALWCMSLRIDLDTIVYFKTTVPKHLIAVGMAPLWWDIN